MRMMSRHKRSIKHITFNFLIMRKLTLFSVVMLLVAAMACDSGKLKEAEAQNARLDDSLKVALENQDSLFSLLNDITAGMDQIRSMEKILSSSADLNSETQSRREAIRNDMVVIQKALQSRRERLAELESKLAQSSSYNSTLKKTIENLKASLAEQTGTIESLRKDLAAAHIEIERLDSAIDSLNATVDTISAAKAASDQQLTNTTNELNKVYYVFGNKAELKDHNIIEGGGFLRKTKIMESVSISLTLLWPTVAICYRFRCTPRRPNCSPSSPSPHIRSLMTPTARRCCRSHVLMNSGNSATIW